ncbi:ZYG11B [Cordylochernes scorpioides]|uniref:ZYG11B n=1 Tax=Cordylochernes scorpioides TaxID=51811 RepID=A0ABY6LIX6_9ARAC|nr:ZYG11B [Cordylochernes scorpioides]
MHLDIYPDPYRVCQAIGEANFLSVPIALGFSMLQGQTLQVSRDQENIRIKEVFELKKFELSKFYCTFKIKAGNNIAFSHPAGLHYTATAIITLAFGIDIYIMIFLEHHPGLRFLGLCEADVCFEDMFINKAHSLYNPDLFVTGCATETQVLRCLEVYAARPNYLQKSLYYLYGYTQLYSYLWPRLDVFKLLLPVLEHYPNVLGIQLAGTACLYSLTRSPRGQRVSLALLRRVVEITLAAMENFPAHQQVGWLPAAAARRTQGLFAQLHKNALLTLCSDRVLQDVGLEDQVAEVVVLAVNETTHSESCSSDIWVVPSQQLKLLSVVWQQFDRFHCTKLVMESLVGFEDHVMNKLSVAICSILAARISTKEASSLGLLYMKRLLGIVEAKVRERDLDILLKFTLSALWNLTGDTCASSGIPTVELVGWESLPPRHIDFFLAAADESPETCRVFLDSGGLDLFLRILKVSWMSALRGVVNPVVVQDFPQEFTVETKVLGLINNIAEVTDLRPLLLNPDFISILTPLMLSENMDVSYFAAGILSHLCSDTELDWGGLDRTYFLDLLIHQSKLFSASAVVVQGKAVTGWKFPETEMVAYRSFNPFFTLLQASQAVQVQLWAVWAILHVCSRNPKRYIRMLTEEGILQMLEGLKAPSSSFPLVASLASDIIRLSQA